MQQAMRAVLLVLLLITDAWACQCSACLSQGAVDNAKSIQVFQITSIEILPADAPGPATLIGKLRIVKQWRQNVPEIVWCPANNLN